MALDIPFRLTGVHYGFSEAKGTLYLEDDFIVLNVTVNVLGMFGSPPEVIKIEPGVLANVELERGWWTDTLKLRARRLKLVKAVPGTHDGGLVQLKIHRKYRDRVHDLMDEIELMALELSSRE